MIYLLWASRNFIFLVIMLERIFNDFKRREDGLSEEHLVGWANIVTLARIIRRLPAQAKP